ncbi:hypothetical protein, partial [Streptomyces sp. PT12]|uniref:hypothetical protein n=1 Tax=Streptomyces sp. PT12 TaxID=1510197 RepID=UPI000DFE4934
MPITTQRTPQHIDRITTYRELAARNNLALSLSDAGRHQEALELRHHSATTNLPCPLTAAQVADVLLADRGNVARMITGTPATGVERVAGALSEVARNSGWHVPPIRKRQDFERQPALGDPGVKRVVMLDLTMKSPEDGTCLASIFRGGPLTESGPVLL